MNLLRSLVALLCVVVACGASDAPSSPLIQAPGIHASPNRVTTFAVTQEGETIVAKFSLRGADGRVTSRDFRFSAATRWAAYFENDFTLWVYRGGDTVVALTLTPEEGHELRFSSSARVLDLRTEAKDIPRPLLEFVRSNPPL